MKFHLSILALAATAVFSLSACDTPPTATPAPAPPAVAVTTAGSNAVQSELQKALAGIEKFNAGIDTDLKSPQGKQFLADLAGSALSITGTALARGVDPAADVAAVDSLGSALEAYSTLPTTSAQLAKITSTAASTSSSVAAAAPAITQLVTAAKAKGVNPTLVVQTIAGGVYAATGMQGN